MEYRLIGFGVRLQDADQFPKRQQEIHGGYFMSKEARFSGSLRALGSVVLFYALIYGASSAIAAETQLLRPTSKTVVSENSARIAANIPSSISLVSTKVYRYETRNFVITNAPTEEMAREFGETAERCRRELALLWLGQEMQNWSEKCPISVKVGELGASGDTTFTFNHGEVYGWEMNVQGTRERIADSVLPHEISHTIFASFFRRPLPRWIDEGAATSVEHISERSNYRRMLLEFVDPSVRRAIPFNRMVEMKEYPKDFLPLYSQCNSVAEFLIGQGGNRRFVEFAKAGLDSNDWNAAVRKYYGYDNLGDLQVVWIRWVDEGFPAVDSYEPAFVRNRRLSSQNASPVLAENKRNPIPQFETVAVGIAPR